MPGGSDRMEGCGDTMSAMRAVSPASVPEIAIVEKVRTCTLAGCNNELKPSQRKYCCAVHKNSAMTGTALPGAGMPPKHAYKPEYATTRFEEYLVEVKENNEEKLVKGANGGWTVLNRGHLPSLRDYALFLGIPIGTLEYWQVKHADFAETTDLIKEWQFKYLNDMSLSGRYSARMAMLHLNINHGMIEKKEIEVKSTGLQIVKHLYDKAAKIEKERYGKKDPELPA